MSKKTKTLHILLKNQQKTLLMAPQKTLVTISTHSFSCSNLYFDGLSLVMN